MENLPKVSEGISRQRSNTHANCISHADLLGSDEAISIR